MNDQMATEKLSMPMGEPTEVEMGEIKVSSCLTDVLVAYGLGACVGVCIYDPILYIAGLAHVVIPERLSTSLTAPRQSIHSPGKFADFAIPSLVDEVCRYGGLTENLRAVLVGGAHIFRARSATGAGVSRLEIGQRNVDAIKAGLSRYNIPIVTTDVGGYAGKTVSMRVNDGVIVVRPIGGDPSVLAVLGRSADATARVMAGSKP